MWLGVSVGWAGRTLVKRGQEIPLIHTLLVCGTLRSPETLVFKGPFSTKVRHGDKNLRCDRLPQEAEGD